MEREKKNGAKVKSEKLSASEYEKAIDCLYEALWWICSVWCCSGHFHAVDWCIFPKKEQNKLLNHALNHTPKISSGVVVYSRCERVVWFMTWGGSGSEQGCYWGAQPKEILWSGRVWCTKPLKKKSLRILGSDPQTQVCVCERVRQRLGIL